MFSRSSRLSHHVGVPQNVCVQLRRFGVYFLYLFSCSVSACPSACCFFVCFYPSLFFVCVYDCRHSRSDERTFECGVPVTVILSYFFYFACSLLLRENRAASLASVHWGARASGWGRARAFWVLLPWVMSLSLRARVHFLSSSFVPTCEHTRTHKPIHTSLSLSLPLVCSAFSLPFLPFLFPSPSARPPNPRAFLCMSFLCLEGMFKLLFPSPSLSLCLCLCLIVLLMLLFAFCLSLK